MTSPPPAIPELLDAADISAALGRDATSDELARIRATSAAVRRAAGWHIGPTVVETVTVDPDGGNVLLLPTGHLIDLQALTIDDRTQDVTTAARMVSWSTAGWVRLRGSRARFGYDPRSVTATITHGHPANSYPDLAQLVVDVARRAQVGNGISQESNGSRSVAYREPGLFAAELSQLAPYRANP